jgi:hypothetical protein
MEEVWLLIEKAVRRVCSEVDGTAAHDISTIPIHQQTVHSPFAAGELWTLVSQFGRCQQPQD